MRYEYECSECGHQYDKIMPLKDHVSEFQGDCGLCGAFCKQEQVYSLDQVIEDWGNGGQGRWFEHLGPKGKTFHDKRSYREHLRREGLVEWSPRRKKGIGGGDI